MADKSGRNKDTTVTAGDVEAAMVAEGLPVLPGEPEKIVETASFLRGAVARVKAAS